MLVCVGACQCSKSVGFHGVGIAEQKCGLSLSGEGRGIERAQKGARSPPASGARARGEMDAGGLACAAIGTCLRTFCIACEMLIARVPLGRYVIYVTTTRVKTTH